MTKDSIDGYLAHLAREERSGATIGKYRRDVLRFYAFLPPQKLVTKEEAVRYKHWLEERYEPASTNSMLVALNSYFNYMDWRDCRVKLLKCQRKLFCAKERELTKSAYVRLVKAAKRRRDERLSLVMQTICATGIRVSELEFITTEAVDQGYANVSCKGKTRVVLLPRDLCRMLKRYCAKKRISRGSVFVTRGGRPLNRSNIWREMKKLCGSAGVNPDQVFPHNLRHLFAVTYYSQEKDIVRLADIMGHSSVETTRIYTATSNTEHERQLARLGLVV